MLRDPSRRAGMMLEPEFLAGITVSPNAFARDVEAMQACDQPFTSSADLPLTFLPSLL
jgi:hypothetical protein